MIRTVRNTLSLCMVLSSGAGLAQSAFNINLTAVRNSVVFLYTRDAAGGLQGGGTGFLMLVQLKGDPTKAYSLLVTARHIVDPSWAGCPKNEGTIFLALNKKRVAGSDAKGTLEYPISIENNGMPAWRYPDDDTVDIAVSILNPVIFTSNDLENKPLNFSQVPTPEELKTVGIGSQVVSAGLLIGAQGEQRNYPIFKFGYVSSVPEEKIPTACCAGCTTRPETEWMIAASLVPGNSGSPIFFVPAGFGGMGLANQRPFLLGVQSTAFLSSDVAGMAPVSFLANAVRKLGLVDADLPAEITATGTPSSGIIPNPAKPAPVPKQ